jgi:hypothetical protein
MRNDYDADDRDRDEDDYEGDGLRWMSVIVVLLVVFGFVSLAWYAYHSGVGTSADGDVPTIEADAGPLKVTPSDPGGMDIPNRDKTVYEAITQGEHSGKTEVLTEAPEEPVLHREDDVAKDGKETQVYRKPVEPSTAPADSPEVAEEEEHEKVVDEAAPSHAGQAVESTPDAVSALVSPTANMANNAPAPQAAQTASQATEPQQEVKAIEKAVIVAAKPEPEPMAVSPQQPAPQVVNDISAAQKASRDASKAKTATVDAKSATPVVTAAPSGGVVSGVQLAASKSRDDAEKLWARLAAKFPDLLGGRGHAIVAAEVVGKGTFYRVRATGLNAASAAELCRQLKARSQDCMVVR